MSTSSSPTSKSSSLRLRSKLKRRIGIGPFTSAGRSKRLPKFEILGSREWKRSFSGFLGLRSDLTSDASLAKEGDVVVVDDDGDVFEFGKTDHTEYSSNFENETACGNIEINKM